MSEIKPALTAEEWARVEVTDTSVGLRVADDYELPEDVDEAFEILVQFGDNTHRTATLLLHNQSFGFTWEDVEHHRRLAGECGNSDRFSIELLAQMEILSAWHLSMANRIQALLPPQDQE